MITEKHLSAQIKRLLRLPFAPSELEDARAIAEEYARHLRRLRSAEEVVNAVDLVMGSAIRCPPPAEVAQAVDSVRQEHERRRAEQQEPPWKRPVQCGDCQDTGWVVVTGPRGDGVKRCPKGCAVPSQRLTA